jgi:hypothetical protein
MIRWCEHNRRSDGARGPQRRPYPLARGTRWVAGPGRGGSRPVSGHALHELSCPRAAARPTPVATLVTGGREAAGGAAHLSGREAAADTSMATYTGHWPSGRRSFRKQRTVNPLMVPARYNFLYSSSRRRVCQRARSSRLWRRPALRPGSHTTVTGESAPPPSVVVRPSPEVRRLVLTATGCADWLWDVTCLVARSLAGHAVNRLAEQVGVAVVAGVLPKHIDQHPAQR